MIPAMGELLKSATEFLTAVLSALGFAGRTRRRANIHLDLKLLNDLRDHPEFGTDSLAAFLMVEHVTNEVARLTGAELKRKRKIEWSSIILAAALGGAAFYFGQRSSTPLSTILYVVTGIMGVSILGGLLPDSAKAQDEESEDTADGVTSG